jgi:hypothetical protein
MSDDTLGRLERLDALRASGALTETEFEAQKAALLGGEAPEPARGRSAFDVALTVACVLVTVAIIAFLAVKVPALGGAAALLVLVALGLYLLFSRR